MRRILADIGSKDPKFYGPEWIVVANDHLSKQLAAGERDKDTILSGFREKVVSALDKG